MPTIHLLIEGKVQGVFFRASTKKTAIALGIRGWVMNRDDGSVEAMATGTSEQLNEFITWCYEGPPGAVVTAIKQSEVTETVYESFVIKH